MRKGCLFLLIGCISLVCTIGFSQPSEEPIEPKQVVELKRFPIDSLEGIITRSGVQLDKQISSDGNGSLRITAKKTHSYTPI
jgi:hypothetical protein